MFCKCLLEAGLAVNLVRGFMNQSSRSRFTVRIHGSRHLFRSEHGVNTRPGEHVVERLLVLVNRAAAAFGRRSRPV